MSNSRKLDVYLRDQLAGMLEQDTQANLTFSYDEAYLATPDACIISVAMPLTSQSYTNTVTKPFFSGLLPDESARVRLANALGVSDTNPFGLLEIIGGDCAGALELHPHDSEIDKQNTVDEVLDETQLADLLHELRGNPLLGSRKDVRLSLAGVQDKIAVNVRDKNIVLVKNGEPTTHILKPAIQGLDGTAQNEAFCMTLASRVGLNVPHAQCFKAKDIAYVLVARFDRSNDNDGVVNRLHQEDFCQALSVPPELKYEEEGGPGIEQSFGLIQRVTNQPAADRLAFLRMQIFHFLVGNADAHAKNVALLHSLKPSAPTLAPLYDVVCTAAYPALTKNIAMRVGARNVPDTIRLKHWLTLVPDTKASRQLLIKELKQLSSTIVDESDKLLSESEHLGFDHPVLRSIVKVINARSTQILSEVGDVT